MTHDTAPIKTTCALDLDGAVRQSLRMVGKQELRNESRPIGSPGLVDASNEGQE